MSSLRDGVRHAGLSLHATPDLLEGTLPLFEAGQVEALEITWEGDVQRAPSWLDALADHYASVETDSRLCAHLVEFPIGCGGRALSEHLRCAREASRRRAYRHVSVHFGVVEVQSFSRIAPMPMLPTRATLARAQEALLRLRDATFAPVGLENLALAFSEDDVRAQPDLLEEMLRPCQGFLLLDLHNLYCQSQNFGLSAEQLLTRYPLERVREVHLSGGSWDHPSSDPQRRPFRRDTHDAEVPEALFDWLALALARCPNLELVMLERLPGTLAREEHQSFQRTFERIRALTAASVAPALAPDDAARLVAQAPYALSEAETEAYEAALLCALTEGLTPAQIRARLREGLPDHARPYVDAFELRALEVAARIQRRWAQPGDTRNPQ